MWPSRSKQPNVKIETLSINRSWCSIIAEVPMDKGLEQNYSGVFDGRLGFGKRPALLIVYFIEAYLSPGSPLYAPDTAEAVRQTRRLYNQAKRASAPVLFTRVLYSRDGSDGGIFLQK